MASFESMRKLAGIPKPEGAPGPLVAERRPGFVWFRDEGSSVLAIRANVAYVRTYEPAPGGGWVQLGILVCSEDSERVADEIGRPRIQS
jgi:hypothetical protein